VRAGRACGIALALVGVEAGCVLLVLWHALLLGVGLHVACASTALVIAWRRAVPDGAVATLQMASMLMPFLGPVAPAAAAAILAVQATSRRRVDRTQTAAIWHEHLFPNLAADRLTEQMDSIQRRQPGSEADEIESFYDVLRWGTLQEQEHVLSLISRSFRPEFAPVLREGLAVADLGLRAQAAAGLSLLEARTSAGIGELQEAFRLAATDEARRELAIRLAQALSEGAHSGLYDEMRTQDMRREIAALLAPLLDGGGAEPALGAMLGRTLIQLGDLDRAVAALEQVVRSGRQTDAAFTWLVEGLFRQGDHRGLAALLERHPDQARALVRADGPLAPALQFWGAPA